MSFVDLQNALLGLKMGKLLVVRKNFVFPAVGILYNFFRAVLGLELYLLMWAGYLHIFALKEYKSNCQASV